MRIVRTALATLLLAFFCTWVQADNLNAVDSTGQVHSISVEAWKGNGKSVATALKHTIQLPDGTAQTCLVSGTDDLAFEEDPYIDIDPVNQEPLLVWSRFESFGTVLQISRFRNGHWSTPIPVWTEHGQGLEPEIDVKTSLLHLIWTSESGAIAQRYRLSLDRKSLEPAFGPELLPTLHQNMVPLEGRSAESGDSPVEAPESDLSYFSSILPPVTPGGPGAMITWGIRDEPIPIVYFEAFELPAGLQRIDNRKSEWVADRFVAWFETGSSLYYTTLQDGYWTDLRIIDLNQDRSAAEALRMIADLIDRENGR
jgi:hypothetical protein